MGFFRAFGDMFRRKSEEHHEELQAYSRDWREGIVVLTIWQLRDILNIVRDEGKSDSEKKREVKQILQEAMASGTKEIMKILQGAKNVETEESDS